MKICTPQENVVSSGTLSLLGVMSCHSWMDAPPITSRIAPFRNWAWSILSHSLQESPSQYPLGYLGLQLLPYILEWQNHFECFSYRCPSRVWFSGTKNSLTLTAAQIILQLHPALLHPTLLPAKPLLEFPLSLTVLSYSPWLLTEVNSFSPSINRNQQVKKFCLMWH